MKTVLITILMGLTLPTIAQEQRSSNTTNSQQDYATLYFYRKPEFYSGRFACWVDELRLVSHFKSASYFWLNLSAGTYEIRTDGKPSWSIYEKKYQLKVEAGKSYYIEAVLDYDFLGTSLILEERSQADFDQLQTKLTFNEHAVRLLD